MLVQKKECPYIAVFKTGSGEEFIAKVVDETLGSFTIEQPLCVVATQNGMQFAPFLMLADPESKINIPKPIITAIPNSAFESQYESATSKIALPKKSGIIV